MSDTPGGPPADDAAATREPPDPGDRPGSGAPQPGRQQPGPQQPGWGGWGGAPGQPPPGGWGDGSGNPYAHTPLPPGGSGWGPYEQPGRPWYRAPGHLVGAATFSAVAAWVVVLCALFAGQIVRALETEDPFTAFVIGMFLMVFVVLAGAVGFVAFVLSTIGAAATVPLAVVWFRDPDRSAGGGVALIHAVVAWAAMAIALFTIPS